MFHPIFTISQFLTIILFEVTPSDCTKYY